MAGSAASLRSVGTHVGQLMSGLDDHVPFLLFPVRLETKFARDVNGASLRVRIFPDAVNISTHDPLLSQGEQASGAAYWAERARALGLGADERRGVELAAWSHLAARYGGPRARYVARTTKPAVWPPAEPGTGTPAPVAPPEDDASRRPS